MLERDDDPRAELQALLRPLESLQVLVDAMDADARRTLEAHGRATEDLHKEAFRRLIRAVRQHPEGAQALREAAQDAVVYTVLRQLDLIKPSLQERLEQALDFVRPAIAEHGGRVELVRVEPPQVEVRLSGACDGCPASGLTLSEGIEKAIREHCPEITEVRKAPSSRLQSGNRLSYEFVSPFANARDEQWTQVARLEEVPEEKLLLCELEGISLLLSRFEDAVVCYENACSHLGLPLEMGAVHERILTCPHHGFAFSLQSGECLTVPELQLRTFAVRVRGDQVEVQLES